jgi:ABC-2 type transport system ATP-binding protein
MNVIETEAVTKVFKIPRVRRDTLREHALSLFRPRRFEYLAVLRSISFSIRAGESIGIMGRNGCGKSTLLKILGGIYEPDSGRVEVRAPTTSILQLGLGWNPELTARDNLKLTGTAMGLTLHHIRRDFDEIIAFAQLERFVDLQLKFYSSGMSARLAYAIAFHAVRDILLLDEIFAVGDVSFMATCAERFRQLHAKGHTMVLVSHDPLVITRHCQRALIIENGALYMDGPSESVAEAYRKLLGQA